MDAIVSRHLRYSLGKNETVVGLLSTIFSRVLQF